MRELKFRAWDDVEKRMYYGNTEQFDDMLGFRFQHFETDKPVYMQYTGLKDKNSKEIYEGDILESNHKLFRFEVIWSEDWAMFTVKGDSVEALIRWATYCEVIGNIYENPELLKGDEDELTTSPMNSVIGATVREKTKMQSVPHHGPIIARIAAERELSR